MLGFLDRRESYQKILRERKLLDDCIITIKSFNFDVYGFIFKRETQWRWFSPLMMPKKQIETRKILIWFWVFKPIRIYFVVKNVILEVFKMFFHVMKWKNGWNLDF